VTANQKADPVMSSSQWLINFALLVPNKKLKKK
jgi:hypothetical protein